MAIDSVLSPEEARQALYLDFEGREGAPPILMGWCSANEDAEVTIEQVVLAEHYRQAALAARLAVINPEYALYMVLSKASDGNRPIVAWSEHELEVARAWMRYDRALAEFDDRFVNARKFAKSWHQAMHPEWSFPRSKQRGRYQLAQFMRHVGYEVPAGAGPGHTGARLGELDGLLRRGKDYQEWTPTQKAKWTNVRRHNEHDLLGMRAICIQAAEELAR